MLDTLPRPAGKVRGHRIPALTFLQKVEQMTRCVGGRTRPRGWEPATPFKSNDVLYDWATIVGKLLLKQGTQYGIGGMYIEFQNVADPDVAVPDPLVNRQDGIEYYNDLAGSGDTDYLRVPLVAGVLGSTDAAVFPGGNSLTFFAQTVGVTGVHGLPFSDANNSKAFGGALVSFVDRDDATRDLVFSRFYFDPESQLVKLASGQIGYEWVLNLN